MHVSIYQSSRQSSIETNQQGPAIYQADDTPSLPLESYTVGWICAKPCELTAASAMLDRRHARPKNQSQHDENNYTLGSIAGHNIAILCVGGGVPTPVNNTGKANDICLGDVVVSLPAEQGGEIDGFRRVGVLNKPPILLQTAVASLRAEWHLGRQLTGLIQEIYPGRDKDVLFAPEYKYYFSKVQNCNTCLESRGPDYITTRAMRNTTHPMVHYGNIESGNSLIKDRLERDKLAWRDNIICFEMEAAGLMDNLLYLVIYGISDYADSHMNGRWQPYAAAAAASFAKKLVLIITSQDIDSLAPIQG
ncbi:nucleoside phosphorylase domain-containing protein [Aspergillus granulosus]|uniref:Nucleoside phosphorylase domain-containing protein n=1 Tax=Aspergillus granulosus TaxID=176169 RepID=A0ABR4GTH5_9EURO